MPVIDYCKAGIEISVVTQHRLDKLRTEAVVQEQGSIRFEENICSAFFFRIQCFVCKQIAFRKGGNADFTVAIATYFETGTQCIDGFYTYTIQADTLFKCFTVIFTTGIQDTDGFYQLSLWDASSVISYTDTQIFFDNDFYFLTGLHLELVDTII